MKKNERAFMLWLGPKDKTRLEQLASERGDTMSATLRNLLREAHRREVPQAKEDQQ